MKKEFVTNRCYSRLQ